MGIHLERAIILFYQQKRFDLAERELREELAENPHLAQARIMLGRCLAERGEISAALIEVKEGIALAPEWSYAHLELGRTLINANRLAEVEAPLRQALRLAPEDVDVLANLAWALYNLKRYQEAADIAAEGLRIDPEHHACLVQRAYALFFQAKLNDVEPVLSFLLSRYPESQHGHALAGWICLIKARQQAAKKFFFKEWRTARQPEHQQALEHFQSSLRLRPGDNWSQNGLRLILLLRSALKSRLLALGLTVLFMVLYLPLNWLSPVVTTSEAGRVVFLALSLGIFVFGLMAFWSYAGGYLLLHFDRSNQMVLGSGNNQREGYSIILALAIVGGVLSSFWNLFSKKLQMFRNDPLRIIGNSEWTPLVVMGLLALSMVLVTLLGEQDTTDDFWISKSNGQNQYNF